MAAEVGLSRVRFLVTGDPQIGGCGDLDLLRRDVDRLIELLESAEFLVVLGDLTKTGTPQQLEAYRAVMAPIWHRTYHVFGGHDGLARQPLYGTEQFERFIGPAWRSWCRDDTHFLALTTERPFLNDEQYAEQLTWLTGELERVPDGVPLVVLCHIPPDNDQYAILRRRHHVLCIFVGHWHTPHRDRIDGTWLFSPGAQRGRDLGAAARTAMTVDINGAQVATRLVSLELAAADRAPQGSWQRRLGSAGQMIGSPVVDADGRVYCPAVQFDTHPDDGGIACIDAGSGQCLWHAAWPGGVLGSPLVGARDVTALTVDGHVVCWQKENGAIRWQRSLYPDRRAHDRGFINCRSQVARCDRGLLVLGSDRPLVLLDARTGRLVRAYEPPSRPTAITAAPVAVGDDFVLATRGEARRGNIATGRVVWDVPTENSRFCSPAAVTDERAFFCAEYFHALDLETGRVLWTRPNPLGAWMPTQPLVRGETVITTGRQVSCLSQASGDVLWAFDPFGDHEAMGFDPNAGGTYGFCLRGDEVIFGCDNGRVYALDAATGRYRWSIHAGVPVKRPPVVVGDHVLVHDYLGTLRAFGISQ